jgi:predicted transposase YbfD/YdcC
MSSKLRNIEDIRKMLDGNHKTQSRKTVSFSDVKMTTDTTHAVGETWTDENGVEWEQRNGFKIKKGKLIKIIIIKIFRKYELFYRHNSQH